MKKRAFGMWGRGFQLARGCGRCAEPVGRASAAWNAVTARGFSTSLGRMGLLLVPMLWASPGVSVASGETPGSAAVASPAAGATSLATPASLPDAPPPLLLALKQELARSMSRLRLKGYESPYFISYTLRDSDSHETTGKLGAVYSQQHDRQRLVHVEVRVGNYELDNTSADGSDGDADLAISLSEVGKDAPLDDDLDALRGTLWQITDLKYKAALAAYASKRARGVRNVDPEDKLPSFSKESAQKAILPLPAFAVDSAAMAQAVRQVGARLKQAPVLDGDIKLTADRLSRYFVSSEGAEVVEHQTLYAAHLTAQTRAKDGMLLTNSRDFYGRTAEQLPSPTAMAAAVDGLVEDLKQLQVAPSVDPYTGPAILMEEAAGVFFHETIGHRLEGERQVSEQEGRTFKGQVGQRVLPDFLSVIDDPTLQRSSAGAIPLNGFYQFDDEGVPARPVTLIENGVLRDYLKSRTPVLGSLRSNGHARASGTSDPIGRMANLVVRASRSVPMSELKAQLLAEVRKQGKPYGLIIRDILGGSTNTGGYGSQTFRGQPTMVYRVDASTGQETLVRGVEMVGTPLSSVAKIVGAANTQGVFNGFCGAESGMVPVSTVAPAVLFTEIELQRAQHISERPPILPAPWRDEEPAKGSGKAVASPGKAAAGKKK